MLQTEKFDPRFQPIYEEIIRLSVDEREHLMFIFYSLFEIFLAVDELIKSTDGYDEFFMEAWSSLKIEPIENAYSRQLIGQVRGLTYFEESPKELQLIHQQLISLLRVALLCLYKHPIPTVDSQRAIYN